MTWEQTEHYLREQIRAQPRGFQTALAERLGISQPAVAQFVGGGKSIPTSHLSAILDMLGLELSVQPRSPQGARP
ncbi:transcriptional regulator [Deinococcus gobiensis]|uniref:HTH cro/C1-type domain-containing protein n=1 Tax=Deinococcus gobiensis (strain DSM 21396 / JCM 16679 / CGMCC 1.7299 / I-0) TaxID=745776 RepID=H8GV91_DEIGI|nr:transcriptional regulator [Deinococcus gobiensis]AFD26766.1 hypothetical protein DGo_CA2839 [Deinococcus gobiensis I-0]